MRNKQQAWKSTPKREFRISPLEVEVRNNDVEKAIKILKNKMSKEGVLAELKRRRYAEKPSEVRRRKVREAEKKLRDKLKKLNPRKKKKKKKKEQNAN